MSGRLGRCVVCKREAEGIYTMDVCRGWTDDKFNFNVEICEECLEKLTTEWEIEPGTAYQDNIKHERETE